MALSALKTWVAEVLTFADLLAEFANILDDDGATYGNPRTSDLDLNGKDLILDADGDSKITMTDDDDFALQLRGQNLFTVDGSTNGTTVTGVGIMAGSTGNAAQLVTVGESNVGLNIKPAGTGEINLNSATIQVQGDSIASYQQIALSSLAYGVR